MSPFHRALFLFCLKRGLIMDISKIKPGDVLFVWGNGLIEKAIEEITHGCSHCALFIDNNTLVEAQAGRKTGTIPLVEYLNSDKHLEVWRDESLTDDERNQMVAYAKDHFGIQYDYLAILVELARFELNFPLNFHEGKRRICSSFINDIVKSVGHNWSSVIHTPAPVDLLNSGKLTRKGELKWETNTQIQNVIE